MVMKTNTKAQGKKRERELQVIIHIDSVLASFASFSGLHDKASRSEICSEPVQLCLSPLNSALQMHLNNPLVFFYKWQLYGCISIIVVKYNNEKGMETELPI